MFAFICLAGGGALLANQLGLLWPQHSLIPEGLGAGRPPGSFTVLLLGTDARPGEKTGRTDSIIVANVETDKNRIALLSIPRDTRVDIPGHGQDKINAAVEYGGPELTAQVVSNLIGMPVQYYALTRWSGFKDIVDTLGGVTVDVGRNMYHYDSSDGPQYAINLRKGVQHLNGAEALEFVRFRDGPLGDIGRTRRQQEFLKALAQEIMQPRTLLKLPELVPEINRCVQTNLGAKEMLAMAAAARSLNQAQIVTQTLPGQFLTINGVSYWGVDPQQAQQVAMNFFVDGKQVARVVEPSPAPSQPAAPSEQMASSGEPVDQSPAPPPAQPPVTGNNNPPAGGSRNGAPGGVITPAPGQNNPASGQTGAAGTGTGENGAPAGGGTNGSGGNGTLPTGSGTGTAGKSGPSGGNGGQGAGAGRPGGNGPAGGDVIITPLPPGNSG
ncbi:hypothetical protein A6M21_15395 [Desulfotomaculum copahuensis]|uniref:Cell envelope-related transcriptional attenuator domain-containing protein n=1 Tax=Desulfotomaculum copahuensis TaxID=1838280 RepID=A0A1B7LBB7_9FIRM|nr:hypothetical protein A6M21_15395 [Desulfotomaculum copahuensis]